MKAAVLKSYREFNWEEKDIPDPGSNEVQLRISFASICGTDMHIFNGDFHPRTPVPFIPGHEMAGIVERTGSGINTFLPGEKVVVDPIIWCGKCPACLSKHFPACESLKLLGIDMDGGLCQFINVDQSMLF
ncbi:MAG: alcohol dehydrogenase catalytic domain-containing protein, partial [Bacteroidetes bacterium]|nr:alcohol dehydrogenase catalytic domain-containing protein [Bacteroidota bacterium]